MRGKVAIFIMVLILLVAVAIGVGKMTGNSIKQSDTETNNVLIQTNYGDIVIQLSPEKAPVTVGNFKAYVKEGFYNNTLFHRVIDGFMVQGGGFDVQTGQEKQTHSPIILESDNGLSNERGTIAMARTSVPNSATSQFFINTVDNDFLDYSSESNPGYAVFGTVIKGMNVVDKISKVKTDASDKPTSDVIIEKVYFVK